MTPTASPPNPASDGIDHINVHFNHSKTNLGRMLSMYYVARFEHPYFGPFKCMEGFVLYLKTGCQDDTFRTLTGVQAKSHYRKQLDTGQLQSHEIRNLGHLMLTAYYTRLVQHPVTATLFKESTLPFDSYYLFGEGKLPIRPPAESGLLIHTLMTLRELMKQDKAPPPLSNEEYAALVIR